MIRETGSDLLLIVNDLHKKLVEFYDLQRNLKSYEKISTKDMITTLSVVSCVKTYIECQTQEMNDKLDKPNVLDRIHHYNQVIK